MKTDYDSALPTPGARRLLQVAGWCVHFYTALGLVAAAGMAVLIVRGGHDSFRWTFVLMVVAMVIDGTDGIFARAVRIKETVPGFDGRRLDDLTDFLNYTFLPLLLIWRAGILPADYAAWLLAPLLASAYGFCQVSAKTDDGYFLGFPSYWNLVAFYLYLFHFFVMPLPGWVSVGVVIGLSLLTFLPMRYLYPTQRGLLNSLTYGLGFAWGSLLVWLLYRLAGLPTPVADAPGSPVAIDSLTKGMILASLIFPVYYMAASWLVTARLWCGRRSEVRP